MDTIEDTRHKRLLILISEHKSAAELATIAGISDAQLSQWRNKSPDSKTGRPRTMDSDSARLLEEKTGKPKGWMDQPVYAENERIKNILDSMAAMSTEDVIKIEDIIRVVFPAKKKSNNDQ